MENASKALIIAGAILLSILIIGLGMFIYQQASGALTDTGIDEQRINAFNSKFTNYSGIITGTQAKNLCDVAAQHNRSATDESEFVSVEIHDSSSAWNGSEPSVGQANDGETAAEFNKRLVNPAKADARAGRTYQVNFAYSEESSLIVAIELVLQ